jgi:tRNA (cmo5U34)-methyltransferase
VTAGGASKKMSVADIRARFDAEVERFSNLETGQTATIDAPLVLDLVTQAAAAVTPGAHDLLDIGCGAGNYSLKLLERVPNLNVTLVDLSRPMLDRAVERVGPKTAGRIVAEQGDVRAIGLGEGRFDVVIAAAVLHHLRTDSEWRDVFQRVYASLRPGGGFWIADFIAHADDRIQQLMWRRYGEYLDSLGGESYREKVFTYVEAEDTPKPLLLQIDLLRNAGFGMVDVLHKNSCFAAFGGVKS